MSISFSFTFRTDESERREALFRLNHQLRRWGLSPTPVGRVPWVDRLKLAAVRGSRAAKRILRRSQHG